jgi:simple sugar transport system ATP-binding protein
MRKLAREEGKTLILVSHKLDEVQELCDHAYVLRRGQLVGEIDIPCPNDSLVEMMFAQIPTRTDRASLIHEGHPAIEFKDLTISTYRLTVDSVNLTVQPGEVFGLAGLEGSGQHLVLQTCAGLIHPANGQMKLCGQAVTGYSYHRLQSAGVAYVAAGRLEAGLVAGLSLTEHMVLAEPRHSFFVDWNSARKESTSHIEKYQIVGTPETYADQLSGGNQQRLLYALLKDNLKLILLEHPTRGLDVRSADWIWEMLYARRAEGTAILFMSADLDEIVERSDRIAVFSGGVMSRIVNAKETTVDELGHLIGGRA